MNRYFGTDLKHLRPSEERRDWIVFFAVLVLWSVAFAVAA